MSLGQQGLLRREVLGQGEGLSPALLGDYRLLTKHQEPQVLFLQARFGRDVIEVEIVPPVFYLHLYDLLPLKGYCLESLAEKAEAGLKQVMQNFLTVH